MVKRSFLLFYLLGVWFSCCAQYDTSISEDFNISCAITGLNYPSGWQEYNNIPPYPTMAWNCTPTHGRGGTPGMQCSGFYSGAYHLDTAWLFTKPIYLNHYKDSIYLRFDSKYEVGEGKSGLSLYLFRYLDSAFSFPILGPPNIYYDLTSSLSPVISNWDSLGWVTHQVSLSAYKTIPTPVYLAFRYISTNSLAGTWTIDNINTTQTGLSVPPTISTEKGLSLAAYTINGKIGITFDAPNPGNYFLAIFDITGRPFLNQPLYAKERSGSIIIDAINYPNGIYFIKMWDALNSVAAKVVVHN